MGRREASALRKTRVVTTRLSAFRFPFVCGLGRAQGNPGMAQAGKPLATWWDRGLAREQKSCRENGSACPLSVEPVGLPLWPPELARVVLMKGGHEARPYEKGKAPRA